MQFVEGLHWFVEQVGALSGGLVGFGPLSSIAGDGCCRARPHGVVVLLCDELLEKHARFGTGAEQRL